MLEFIPKNVKSGKKLIEYPLNINSDNYYIVLSYFTNMARHIGHNIKRGYYLTIPRYIRWSNETFEVLGLLKAEMGKTHNGCIVFANSECRIINKVMKWFDEEIEIMSNDWRWYVKVNINEPNEEDYKKEVEEKVINYWLNKTKIHPDKKHPKTVSYIRNTENKRIKYHDHGTLIIEYKSNLLSQIIKRYVKLMSHKVPNLGKKYIRGFIRGILAGESSIVINKRSKVFQVILTANKKYERDLYQNCLARLNINILQYKDCKDMRISKRVNNIKLLKQKLMCLNHKKYNKFLNMMKLYQKISEETGYFNGRKEPHNKIPQEKINKILKLYYQNPDWPCWKIAKKVIVSPIKVNRVLKENNLGKRLIKTSESKRKAIAKFLKENLKLTQKQIAEYFGVNESVVKIVCQRYGIDRENRARCKIPEEKEKRIIEIYKQNPIVKFSEISEKVGISHSVIKRVRKENGLAHLGYKYLVGCNNPSYKKSFR